MIKLIIYDYENSDNMQRLCQQADRTGWFDEVIFRDSYPDLDAETKYMLVDDILVVLEGGFEINHFGEKKFRDYISRTNPYLVCGDRNRYTNVFERDDKILFVKKTGDPITVPNSMEGAIQTGDIYPFFQHIDYPFLYYGNYSGESRSGIHYYLDGRLLYRYMWKHYTILPPMLDVLERIVSEKDPTNNSDKKIEVHSCFENTFTVDQKRDDTVYILYFYENPQRYPVDETIYDFRYSLSVTEETPCSASPINVEIQQKLFGLNRQERIDQIMAKKNRFCCFIVSNGCCQIRNQLFKTLNRRYKRVDSLGRFMRNTGEQLPDRETQFKEYIEFISQYKFIISMENSINPGYVTEKIVNGFMADTIPIYWGTGEVKQIFNDNAYLNISDYSDLNRVVDRIREIDSDDNLYRQYLLADPVLDTFRKDYSEDLVCKLDKILE